MKIALQPAIYFAKASVGDLRNLVSGSVFNPDGTVNKAVLTEKLDRVERLVNAAETREITYVLPEPDHASQVSRMLATLKGKGIDIVSVAILKAPGSDPRLFLDHQEVPLAGQPDLINRVNSIWDLLAVNAN